MKKVGACLFGLLISGFSYANQTAASFCDQLINSLDGAELIDSKKSFIGEEDYYRIEKPVELDLFSFDRVILQSNKETLTAAVTEEFDELSVSIGVSKIMAEYLNAKLVQKSENIHLYSSEIPSKNGMKIQVSQLDRMMSISCSLPRQTSDKATVNKSAAKIDIAAPTKSSPKIKSTTTTTSADVFCDSLTNATKTAKLVRKEPSLFETIEIYEISDPVSLGIINVRFVEVESNQYMKITGFELPVKDYAGASDFVNKIAKDYQIRPDKIRNASDPVTYTKYLEKGKNVTAYIKMELSKSKLKVTCYNAPKTNDSDDLF